MIGSDADEHEMELKSHKLLTKAADIMSVPS